MRFTPSLLFPAGFTLLSTIQILSRCGECTCVRTAVVEAGILKENCPNRKISIKDNSNRSAYNDEDNKTKYRTTHYLLEADRGSFCFNWSVGVCVALECALCIPNKKNHLWHDRASFVCVLVAFPPLLSIREHCVSIDRSSLH